MHKKIKIISLIGIIMLFSTQSFFSQSSIHKPKQDRVLKFDFAGMNIGVAEYEEGPTGTTVFYFPDGVMGAADVRGGATGTLNTHAVMDGYEDRMIDAVVFSGGSWYGLSAATGVANGIKDVKYKEGRVDYVACVLGGIIYDVGGRRFSRITPDDQLGREALKSAKPNWFPLGARGAGRFAMQGVYYPMANGGSTDSYSSWSHSGQGAAFATVGKTKIAVFTVVNAMGAIVDRKGQIVRCNRNKSGGGCLSIEDFIKKMPLTTKVQRDSTNGPTNNTTVTLIVTNQKLPFWALQRLATQVHTSMGRAIQPFSTQDDGDVLYAVSTGAVDNPDLSPIDLAMVTSELAWDAVLNSVPELPELPTPIQSKPDSRLLKLYAGTYDFYGGGKLIIALELNNLTAKFIGNGRIFFEKERLYKLIPATDGLFIIDAPACDVIRFDLSKDNSVTGITIDPGPWNIVAKRKQE